VDRAVGRDLAFGAGGWLVWPPDVFLEIATESAIAVATDARQEKSVLKGVVAAAFEIGVFRRFGFLTDDFERVVQTDHQPPFGRAECLLVAVFVTSSVRRPDRDAIDRVAIVAQLSHHTAWFAVLDGD
jgi:hypothetical protein